MSRLGTLLLCTLYLVGCAGPERTAELEGWIEGREFSIRILSPPQDKPVEEDLAAARARMGELLQLLAVEGPGSEIAQVNALAGLRSGTMSRATYDLLMRCFKYKRESGESFDFLCGPLYRLWGYREAEFAAASPEGRSPIPRVNRAAPEQAAIDSVLALVNQGGTFVVDLGVLLSQKGMEIDLEQVLEGYVLDQSKSFLVQRGYMNLELRLGGSTRVLGQGPDGGFWSVDLADPRNPEERLGRLKLRDRALGRAAVDQRRIALNDLEVNHLIDPATGRPGGRTLAVWVL